MQVEKKDGKLYVLYGDQAAQVVASPVGRFYEESAGLDSEPPFEMSDEGEV